MKAKLLGRHGTSRDITVFTYSPVAAVASSQAAQGKPGLTGSVSSEKPLFSREADVSMAFPGGSVVQDLVAKAGDAGDLRSIPESEDPLEEETVTHSSTVAWRMPWMKEPGGLQSMGSQRVRHD